MANSWFAGLHDRFVLVSVDTSKGVPHILSPYKVRRNRAYLIVANRRGEAVLKLEHLRLLDPSAKQKVENAWRSLTRENLDVLQYALTYGHESDLHQSVIGRLVKQLQSHEFRERQSAHRDLLATGEAGYRQLHEFVSEDEEVNWRVQAAVKHWSTLRQSVQREGLDHDIAYLASFMAQDWRAAVRLVSILPKDTPITSPAAWWKANHIRYDFVAARQQYVLRCDNDNSEGLAAQSAELTRNK